jgi:hypothetical protein
MQELTFEQVEEVSGGIFINPVTVMIGVRLGQMALPHVQKLILGAAAYVGADEGTRAAE